MYMEGPTGGSKVLSSQGENTVQYYNNCKILEKVISFFLCWELKGSKPI